jgi:hypothetical protein
MPIPHSVINQGDDYQNIVPSGFLPVNAICAVEAAAIVENFSRNNKTVFTTETQITTKRKRIIWRFSGVSVALW